MKWTHFYTELGLFSADQGSDSAAKTDHVIYGSRPRHREDPATKVGIISIISVNNWV